MWLDYCAAEFNTLHGPLLSDRSGVSGGTGLSEKSVAAQNKRRMKQNGTILSLIAHSYKNLHKKHLTWSPEQMQESPLCPWELVKWLVY